MTTTYLTVLCPQRKKPQVGDRKLIQGVPHVRRLKHCYDTQGNCIGLDHTNGRYHYEWVKVEGIA